jgi:hypothetical protein
MVRSPVPVPSYEYLNSSSWSQSTWAIFGGQSATWGVGRLTSDSRFLDLLWQIRTLSCLTALGRVALGPAQAGP